MIKTNEPDFRNVSQAALRESIKVRDQVILEAFKKHKTPTATVKSLDGMFSREIIRRVATRAGLWDLTLRDKLVRQRAINRDPLRAKYYRSSKQFITEMDFQSHIADLLKQLGIEFQAEVQVPGFQSRADFVGNDFVIEAKNTVASDELCRGLGQALIYRHSFKGKRVAIVYPEDLEHNLKYNSVFADNGISIIPYNFLAKWLS